MISIFQILCKKIALKGGVCMKQNLLFIQNNLMVFRFHMSNEKTFVELTYRCPLVGCDSRAYSPDTRSSQFPRKQKCIA